MKKKRPHLQLNDEQQLALGLLLVILVALSLLYCLGFASVALREAWENTNLPWTTPETGEEILDVTPALVTPVTPSASPTPSSQPDGGSGLPISPSSDLPIFDRTLLHRYNLHAVEHPCRTGLLHT